MRVTVCGEGHLGRREFLVEHAVRKEEVEDEHGREDGGEHLEGAVAEADDLETVGRAVQQKAREPRHVTVELEAEEGNARAGVRERVSLRDQRERQDGGARRGEEDADEEVARIRREGIPRAGLVHDGRRREGYEH
eukprot:2026347-Prymnesium_polylepis.1